jgi:hypothetical protein
MSLYGTREGNLDGGLIYRGLCETCNRRLWKHSISFQGLHKGRRRHVARAGSGNTLIALTLYLINYFVVYNLEVSGLTVDHNTLRDISLWARASGTQKLLEKLNQDQSRLL